MGQAMEPQDATGASGESIAVFGMNFACATSQMHFVQVEVLLDDVA